jgi:glycosyltransferase involved in cell wall biosynthesis
VFEVPLAAPAYEDAWLLSYVERARMFHAEGFRVAYLDPEPNNSSFRYRAFNAANLINEHVPGVSASWFFPTDGTRLLEILRSADVLVLGRAQYTAQLAELAGVARRFGARIVFDVDDYVFDPSVVPQLIRTLDQPVHGRHAERTIEYWFANTARTRATAELADEIIVTNDYLADRAREAMDKPVRVIPNYMGNDQLAYSAAVVAAREAAGSRRTEQIHLGYFSGTPSHNRDFAIAAPAIARLLRSDERVRLRVVGYLDKHQSTFAGLEERIEFVPLTNYLNLQRLIGETEVNVAPLQNNRFTNCKSELKYFDAGIVGIPTLASPTFTMSRAIEHGVNGFIVRNHEWDEYLQRIVADYDTLGRQLGAAALAHCAATYTPTQQTATTVAALNLPTSAPSR